MKSPFDHETALQHSIEYLESDEALSSIEKDPYWPKWDSPWWHMSLLFEMGRADLIPKGAAQKMLSAVQRTHLPYFFSHEAPADRKSYQDAPCPCAFGNLYQFLSATGLAVDQALPWARGWFLKYQMPDGGLSCDEAAYTADPGASSLVGTIAPLEAILSVAILTSEEERFLDRGAQCLLDRELRLGSRSQQNAEEREDESDWLKPCFPRFYLYDVLRGLSFILKWADRRNQKIPQTAIARVVQHLKHEFPDGKVRMQRQAYQNISTRLQADDGQWKRGALATLFPLLIEVSPIGADSHDLSAQWADAQLRMQALNDRGLII